MAKKTVEKRAGRGSDQYMIRFPDGLRDAIAKRAAENGRSMNTEIIAAIEQYLEGVDRLSSLEAFIEKHKENIVSLDDVWVRIDHLEFRAIELGRRLGIEVVFPPRPPER
jgi:hypothetical protein